MANRILLAVGAIAALVTGAASAQEAFPTRPITVVVPYAPGGGSDTKTRLVAAALSKMWGQQVIVENKPGGGTVIGVGYVARSRPDGYTLGQIAPSFLINGALKKDLPYDTEKDLVGLGIYANSVVVIAANPNFGPSNIRELVAEAKKPGANLRFATSGIGGITHLTGELLQKEAGIKMTHVPFKGSSETLPDTLSGRIPIVIDVISLLKPLIDDGKLKPIAVATAERIASLPNVQTIREDYPGVVVVNFSSWIAPSGVPADVLAKINDGIRKVATSPEFIDQVIKSGDIPATPASVVTTTNFFKTEIQRWKELGAATGITIE